MSSYPNKFPHTQYGLTFNERSDWVQFLKAKAESIAASKGIPRGVMGGIIEQESSWGAGAVNTSNKNGSTDAGLTQINSVNWPAYGIKKAEDLTRDPINAIEIGADILSKNLRARGGDVVLAIADYNQGQGATNAQIKDKKPPSTAVQKYITNVMFRSSKYGAPYPTSGDIQQLENRLGFKPDVAVAAKAAGLDPGVVQAAAPALAAVEPNTPLTLPTAQTSADADYERQVAQIEADAANATQQLTVDPGVDTQPLEVTQPPAQAAPAPVPVPYQDLSLQQAEAALPDQVELPDVEERLTAAFGPQEQRRDTSGLPKFVDSLITSVLKN